MQLNIFRQPLPLRLINSFAYLEATLFSLLYSVWNLPGTNFLSDLCLIFGALIGLVFIWQSHKFFFSKESIPIYALLLILIFALLYPFIWSNDFNSQLKELTSIWKRVAIATLFAIGFGISCTKTHNQEKIINIIYVGLIIPPLFFYLKLALEFYSTLNNFDVPSFLRIYDVRISRFYIAKPEITFFYFPAIIFSMVRIYFLLKSQSKKYYLYIAYLIVISSTINIFYIKNIKNGVIYSMIIYIIFLAYIFFKFFMRKRGNAEAVLFSKRNIIISISILILTFNIAYISVSHYQSNSSWQYFIEDVKLGLEVEKYHKWKNVNSSEYLVNEANVVTSNTNYYRVAWLIIGSKLLMENPMGYGLLEYSFSHLAEKKWKDTNLAQAHNSWLDFALAFGFPGLILLLSASILAAMGGSKSTNSKNLNSLLYSVISTLIVLDILWLTSEVDFKYSLPTMFFWIAFLTSLKNKY